METWEVRIPLIAVLGWIPCLFLLAPPLHAAEVPHIQMVNGTGQLIVNGHPFLILGGELGNSSPATAAQADAIIPKLASMHVNTILMPVAWEQFESKEGSFDFSILDHWIETARDPDVDSGIAGIESVEEVSRASGQWKIERPLNGDQTNQGRIANGRKAPAHLPRAPVLDALAPLEPQFILTFLHGQGPCLIRIAAPPWDPLEPPFAQESSTQWPL